MVFGADANNHCWIVTLSISASTRDTQPATAGHKNALDCCIIQYLWKASGLTQPITAVVAVGVTSPTDNEVGLLRRGA